MSEIDILTPEQAAELLQLSAPTIRSMASRGIVPGRKLGGKYWRFSSRQLLEFIAGPVPRPAPRSGQERRREAIRLATPPWADMVAISAVYARCRYITSETGIAHEVDHVIPLQGLFVCGLHVEANLSIVPAKDNRSKSNRWDEP